MKRHSSGVPSRIAISVYFASADLAKLLASALISRMSKQLPSLTREQAFEKVYTDPANRSLAAAERSASMRALGAE
jgi:hypothetical protein